MDEVDGGGPTWSTSTIASRTSGQNQKGKGGAAHLNEGSRAGTKEEVSKLMRTQDVVLGSRNPGLRAFRIGGYGSRSSHGTSEDGQDVEKDQRDSAEASASGGSSTPFPAGRSLFDDVSGLVSRIRHLELHTGVDEYKTKKEEKGENTKKDEKHEKSLGKKVEASGSQEKAPSARGADHLQGQRSELGEKGDERWIEEPWTLMQFQDRPSASKKDEWCQEWQKHGWLIRAHKKGRKRLFHPLHSSLPIDIGALQGDRITIMVGDQDGVRSMQKDQWSGARSGSEKQQWRGWTFFRLKREGALTGSQPSQLQHAEGAHSQESDGSYEFIKD